MSVENPGGQPQPATSKTVQVVVLLAAALVAGLAAALGGPKTASVLVDLSILGYAFFVTRSEVRLVALASMLGAHLGAILSYYSNPLPIPPIAILEKHNFGIITRYSLNVDIVSLLLVYEILSRLYSTGLEKEVEAEETLKAPEEGYASNMGPEEPR